MTDINMNEHFLTFLRDFRTGASSSYFLDEFILNNSEIFELKEGIFPVYKEIHYEFQQACLENLDLTEKVLPDYLPEQKAIVNRKLLHSVSKKLENAGSLSAEAKIDYKDIAREMLEKVFTPLNSAAELFNSKLKNDI